MENVLVIKNLSKRFGSHQVIDDISLEIKSNTVLGFLGNNGAGKTTTMKMILGLMKPDAGEIYVCGEKVRYGDTKTNKNIGYLPDVPAFYSYLTPREYLRFCAEITSVPKQEREQKITELLEFVGLSKKANKKIKGFSRGMKQRLGIAQALINEPKLLICDEPTSALDPVGRVEILDILHNISEKTTVIFSTHILSDVERICDNVAMLNEGKIALSGSITELKSSYHYDKIQIRFLNQQDKDRISELLKQNESIQIVSEENQEIIVQTASEASKAGGMLMEMFHKERIIPKHFEIMEPSLENLFMKFYDK